MKDYEVKKPLDLLQKLKTNINEKLKKKNMKMSWNEDKKELNILNEIESILLKYP